MALTHHRANLTVSNEQVALGHSTILSWKVVGVAANIASIHLRSMLEDGVSFIESATSEGSREMIFSRPGTFTFTLTATFGDGAKLSREVTVHVERPADGFESL